MSAIADFVMKGINRGNGNPHIILPGFSPAEGAGLWESCPWMAILCDPNLATVLKEGFIFTPDTGRYTLTEDAGKTGTDALIDQIGSGWLQYCDGDDNDESYRYTIGEPFIFAASKPLWFECEVKLTEANTDDANWIVGLMDAFGANALLDNGGGPAASYDGAVFFKVDGTMNIQFETSNAGTQVTTAAAKTFVSATTFKLGFVFDPGDGTTGTITPYIDDVAGTAHSITLAGLAEMNLGWGVKAGGANEEAIEISKLVCVQIN